MQLFGSKTWIFTKKGANIGCAAAHPANPPPPALWECSFKCKSLLNFNDLATKLENCILRYLTFIHRQYSISEVNYQVVVSSNPTWIMSISIIVTSIEYWHRAIVRPGCAYCKDGVDCCQLGCEMGKVICDRDCNYWDSTDNTDLIKTDPLSMLF